MRRLTIAAPVALLAAATLWAQQNDTLTFKDGKSAAEGVDVVAFTNDDTKSMGTTDAAGVLAGIDPIFYTLKPQGSAVIVQECDGETKTYDVRGRRRRRRRCGGVPAERGRTYPMQKPISELRQHVLRVNTPCS